MSNLGTLYGVGVGPGDPELITVKAFRIIQESPVIAYPRKRKGNARACFSNDERSNNFRS